ncbi:MAG: flagellar assembly protein FliH [Thiomonas sp. 14-64-326]|jgi:flagellar assembly protein FliH|uniref:FliH/SctL family protein n=1 Tax=Thiomonas sp. TaxID=2047785 RepID=UPI000BCB8DBB|nr:FliH/SctL family protein [Thiomonas sp.]OZB71786.1 MAG: flagellar assembly protein FliH [Thiomonas sp. 14-64-326]
MSGIIPKEDAQAARRWQPPEMDPAAHTAVQTPRQTAGGPPTAQQFEAVYAQAEAQGREDGRQAGLEQGHREGYAAGHAEGLAAGRAQAQQERETLQALLSRVTQPVAALDAEAETALVALALELARQVILQELRTQPEALLPIVRKALAAFPAQAGAPSVRLHPLDLDVLRNAAPDLESSGVTLLADDTLQRGDLIVAAAAPGQTATPDRRWRTRSREAVSELDLRVEERWRQIMTRLFEEGLQ